MAFAVGFAYWKSLRSPRWGIAAGVLFGVALGVKHNAWLMPFFSSGHYLWMRRGDSAVARCAHRRAPPLAFVAMLVLGPDRLLRALALAVARAGRAHARLRAPPPRSTSTTTSSTSASTGTTRPRPPRASCCARPRPFVETGFTVPVTTLALAAVGVAALVRRRRGQPAADGGPAEGPAAGDAKPSWLRPGADVDRAPGAFLAGADARAAGGARRSVDADLRRREALHAGDAVSGRDGRHRRRPPDSRVLAARAAGGAARALARARARRRWRRSSVCRRWSETRRSHPDGLSHYNLLAGGFAGGASLGMNRQFWGYSVLPMLDVIDRDDAREPRDVLARRHPRRGQHVQTRGRLPLTVGDTGFGEDGIAPLARSASCSTKSTGRSTRAGSGRATARRKPFFVREREGVPLVTMYREERPVTAVERADPSAASRGAAVRRGCRACCGGWRGAVIVYVVFTGAYLGAAGGRLRQPLAVQPLRLSGRRLAARAPGAARPAAERERLGQGRRAQAARRARGARHLRQPHGRLRPIASTRCAARPRPFRPTRSSSRSSIRYVSFPPFPAVLMLPFVAIWGLTVQRRAVHGAVGRAQPDAAVSAAARPARAAGCRAAPKSTTCG